jgi:N-methylhydantoinase B
MEITSREDAPFGIFASFERVLFPARGRDGAGPGATGRISLASGKELRNKGFQTIPAQGRLIIEMPGGGGYGDPKARDPEAVADDVRLGLVSPEAAARDYGVVVGKNGQIDEAATAKRRG